MTQPGPALVGEPAKQEAYVWIKSLDVHLAHSDLLEIQSIRRLVDYARRHPDPELTEIARAIATNDVYENRMHRELSPVGELVANA